MFTMKEKLEDQLTKENNRLNAMGDDLLVAKELIDLLNITGLQPVIDTLYDEFESISHEIGSVAGILKRARTKEVLRSCIHIINQQSFRVASFSNKVSSLVEIVNKY